MLKEKTHNKPRSSRGGWVVTFGDVIGPKKLPKYHRYRSNNRLRPNGFIYVYRIGIRIDLYFIINIEYVLNHLCSYYIQYHFTTQLKNLNKNYVFYLVYIKS